MKRLFLLPVLLFCLTFVMQAGNDKGNDLQKKSELKEPYGYIPSQSSFPMPFTELTQSATSPAISTGYYFYDTEQNPLDSKKITDIWSPKDKTVPDTTNEPTLWRRILAGPRIVPKVFWENNPYGQYYFRNPADMLKKDIYDPASGAIDTIKNAIAGPMPIGIKGGFYFNGLRYDSFYVSSNGIIGLTNRRYIYDETGARVVPSGAKNCYDIYSMDWFCGGLRSRSTTGNGLDDESYDDFGYNCAILGRNPDAYYPLPSSDPFFNATAGLRSTGKTDLSAFTTAGWTTTNCKPALIAPFWGNISLSQYNAQYRMKEDYGKVYFKTTKNGDSLIIAFYNATFRGTVKDVPAGTYTYPENARANNMIGYCEWDAKVVLNKRDSSITFNYSRLTGTSPNNYSCGDLLRANTTAGVLGWARHINYSTKNPAQQVQPTAYSYPWSAEYMQYTHYFSNNQDINNKYPINGTSVKFKQWRNTLRALNIVYRIRDSKQKGPDYSYDFLPDAVKAPDYEMLAGESLIGAIQPVGVIQNLTNDIQGPNGVNYVAQDLEFKAMFIITNVITDRVVYSRDIPVNQLCLGLDGDWTKCANDLITRVRLVKAIAADPILNYKVSTIYSGAEVKAAGFTGIPPYKFVEVTYPAFEPNEFIDNQIGRMHCKLIARPVNVQGQATGDKWPFDDTLSIRLFVIRRINTFNDDISEFNVESNTGFAIPSVLKWVTIDAYAADGDEVSMHPLPPRGEFKRTVAGEEKVPVNAPSLKSPVIQLNRTVKVYGKELEAEPLTNKYKTEFADNVLLGGDEIRSFPIDLRERFGAVLSFSLQRGKRLNPGYNQDYYRGWGDKNLQGPEGKMYFNTSPFTTPIVAGNGGSADILSLEFAKPSIDGLNGICNIPEADWRYLPHRKGSKTKAATNMPVLTLYGGGGYLRGFLKEDPDSVLDYPNPGEMYFNALDEIDYYKYFLFDEGLDWEYKKFAVQIPDTFIRAEKEGAKNFRFRFKVMAKQHNNTQFVPDDYDDFFVDNVNILFKDTLSDLECGSVRIDWPFTLVPASQATNIPVIVKIANNTSIASETFGVKVRIYRDGEFSKDSLTSVMRDGEKIKPLYCRVENIANLKPGTEIEVQMPAWNARKSQTEPLGKYIIVANVVQRGKDLLPNNDTTFFDAELRFGDAFAYDPVENPKSDVAAEVKIPGRGLNLPGASYEKGAGAAWPELTDENRAGAGIITNSWSGRMATRFDLANTDTVKGFQVYFTSLNASPDFIEFAIIRKNSQLPTEKIIPAATMYARRGDVGNGKRVFNQYITYKLDTPVELAADVYWVSITQMATDGMNLGGSGARSAMKVSNWFQHPITGQWGVSGSTLYLDKNFRLKKGDRYVNQNFFAYVNAYPSDNWQQFTPTTGLIAYAHTNHQGRSLVDGTTPTYVNGTWIPMLRPYFGERSYGEAADSYEECPDDMVPVDMIGFKGNVRQAGIELIWETATETNNYGFEVQRRDMGDNEWNLLGFVTGAGTSLTHKYYTYLDKNVDPSSTYQYRIRQIDNDGTVSCKSSDIVTVKYENIGELTLNQNIPNPFNALTDISFYLPTEAIAKLEIVDLLGNTVKVLNNSALNAGKHNFRWDSKDEFGNDVANGTYIYRLVVADQVRTAKMTLMK